MGREVSFYFSTAENWKKMAEDAEDPREAIEYYLRAAEAYNTVISRSTDKDMITIAERMRNECIRKVKFLMNPKPSKTKVSIGHSEYSEGEERRPSYEILKPNLTFEDVIGMEKLKEDLEDMILGPLVDPQTYKAFIGEEDYQGVLLFGPPGCGKTYTIKAAAGEFCKRSGKNIKFIYVRSSDLLSSWVGESEKNIRELFELAAKEEPCVLFFDEIEGLGMVRSGRSVYADRFVNEFLSDFELIKGKNVIVIGATNFPWRVDPALVRRLSVRIMVDPPDYKARKGLFQHYLRGRKIADDIDYDLLAEKTLYYATSDIKEICRVAGRKARRDYLRGDVNRKITLEDLLKAIDEVGSSLYQWAVEAKKQLSKDRYRGVFPKLLELAERIESYFQDKTAGGVFVEPNF